MDKPLTSSLMDFEIRLPEAIPSNAFLVFFVPWWFIFRHIRANSSTWVSEKGSKARERSAASDQPSAVSS